MAARKGNKDGRATRSDSLTIRLDPKLKYLADLAARRQRRTLTSLMEWALEEALKRVPLSDANGNELTAWEASGLLWDVAPSDRFLLLAQHLPELLTYEEQLIWKAILTVEGPNTDDNHVRDMDAVRYRFTRGAGADRKPDNELIAALWDELVAHGSGDLSLTELRGALDREYKRLRG